MTELCPRHPTREPAGPLTDIADELASWLAGHTRDRSTINSPLSWITALSRS